MTLGAVVIGLGQIGMVSDLSLDPREHVYTHARAFNEHPAYELLAGVDGDAQRRKQFQEIYRRPAYGNVEDALKMHSPDVVAVAVPTAYHAAVLRQVLATCRPHAILCEKPLSYDINEAREMVSLCEQANCQLFINYVRRADPAVREIKRRLDSGQIATPLKGVVWYSKGLFNNGSHFFDLLQYWLGEMQSFQLVQRGRTWGEDPEPDLAVTFANGRIHFLAAREEDFSHYTVELVSPNGRLRYDLGGERVVWQPAVASVSAPGYTVLDPAEQGIPNALSRIQWHVADQLAVALLGEPAAVCTGSEALRTIEHLTSIKNAL